MIYFTMYPDRYRMIDFDYYFSVYQRHAKLPMRSKLLKTLHLCYNVLYIQNR